MNETQQFPVAPGDTTAGPVETCEDWLVATCRRVLGSVFPSVESGPGEWSDAYLARVIQVLPAVRVAFLGGEGRKSEDLDIDSRWAIYIATGWSGQREADRRRGRSGMIGAWRAASILAPWLHHCTVGGQVGQVRVAGITNLWAGDLDRKGMALVSINCAIPLHFDAQIMTDDFDAFLRAGVDWSIETAAPGDDPERTPAPFDVRTP